jgi:alpha-amylase
MLTVDDVIYMIMTDRFNRGGENRDDRGPYSPDDPKKRHGGNLMGIVERLPYLKDLGITTIWISPVYLNPPDSYHGYHPLDFDSVDLHLCSPELGPEGSRETIRKFVEIAHTHGFKVMLDMIVSHTGKEHPWLVEHPEFINWSGGGVEKDWFEGLPNINHDNLDANIYFIRGVLDWIGATNIDAVRIDAARHVESRFWQHSKVFLPGLAPSVTVIGEFWDGNPQFVAPFQNTHGFNSMFDFPLYHAIRDVFIDDYPFQRIARPRLNDREFEGILDLDPIYRNSHRLVTFIGNHDTSRFFESAGGIERPDEAMRRMKMALMFVMTVRGIPQVYYGDELAMLGGYDPDNRRDMPWSCVDDVSLESAEASRAKDMRAFTRSMIAVRKDSDALRWGLHATLYVSADVYVYLRFTLDDIALVGFNNRTTAIEIDVPLWENPRIPLLVKALLSDGVVFRNELDHNETVEIDEGDFPLRLDGRSSVLFRTNTGWT